MVLLKQMKLFRNCPKEIAFNSDYEANCRNCPEYEKCTLKKKRIAKRWKALRKRRIKLLFLLGIVALLLLCLIGVIKFLLSLDEDIEVRVVSTEAIDTDENEDETSKESDADIANIQEGQKSERYRTQIVMVDEMPEEPKEIGNEAEELREIQDETNETNETMVLLPEISPYAPNEVYYYDVSYEDKIIIGKTLFAECRGECFRGKVAVAAVILNRFYSGLPEFDTESIYTVITQGNQFADISKITIEDLESVPECMEAVEAACKGWDPTRELFPEGAKHFYAPKGDIAPYQLAIREGIQELSIGNHNFHNDFNMEDVEERVERIIAEQNAR